MGLEVKHLPGGEGPVVDDDTPLGRHRFYLYGGGGPFDRKALLRIVGSKPSSLSNYLDVFLKRISKGELIMLIA